MKGGITATTTESRLLNSAIDLFGRYGTKAVPLLQIRKHAKVANDSAIRYYFVDKNGLIRHCVMHVAAHIIPPLTRLVDQLESAEEAPTSCMVLTQIKIQIVQIFEVFPSSICFLSTLSREFESEGNKYLVKTFSAILTRYERLLGRAMPNKAPDLLHIHFLLAINHTLYSIIDRDRLASIPWLLKSEPEFEKRTEMASKAYLAYILAGVSSSA
jgi:AcrR family transcriptional regulator